MITIGDTVYVGPGTVEYSSTGTSRAVVARVNMCGPKSQESFFRKMIEGIKPVKRKYEKPLVCKREDIVPSKRGLPMPEASCGMCDTETRFTLMPCCCKLCPECYEVFINEDVAEEMCRDHDDNVTLRCKCPSCKQWIYEYRN